MLRDDACLVYRSAALSVARFVRCVCVWLRVGAAQCVCCVRVADLIFYAVLRLRCVWLCACAVRVLRAYSSIVV